MVHKLLRLMGRRFKKDQRGFTLIELLVVIAVIGVLATLAVPRVVGVIDDAKANRGKSDVKVIAVALERYYLANGQYPGSLGTLKTDKYLKGDFDLKNAHGKWYFYAIPDENLPDEYVLGDPGKNPDQHPGETVNPPQTQSTDPPYEGKANGDAFKWGTNKDFSAKPDKYAGVVTE